MSKRRTLIGALLLAVAGGCGPEGSPPDVRIGTGGAGGAEPEPAGQRLGLLVECDETRERSFPSGNQVATVSADFAWLPVADVTAVQVTRCGSYSIVNGVRQPQEHEHGGPECRTSRSAGFTGDHIYIECERRYVYTNAEGATTSTNTHGSERFYVRYD